MKRRFSSSSNKSKRDRGGDGNNENVAINCINCMSHSTENLYRYRHTSLIRASDDFYPRRPYSHTVHLINVAYNSLFLREICLPDWDMFQSLHPSASLHAAARAIGGCPIYVSDVPGHHDVDLLKRLVLKDGSVLRASQSGVPTRDCLFENVGHDGVSALKIWNWNGYKDADSGSSSGGVTSRDRGSGVVGAFHVQGVMWNFNSHENHQIIKDDCVPLPPVEALIQPQDIEVFRDDEPSRSFVAYVCQSRQLYLLETSTSQIRIPLKHREWEIITIVPMIQNHNLSVAPIGLADMLNPGGAIVAVEDLRTKDVREEKDVIEEEAADGDVKEKEEGFKLSKLLDIEITCRGPGRFLMYSSQCPAQLTISDGTGKFTENHPFVYDSNTGRLELELPDENGGPHRIVFQWKTPAIESNCCGSNAAT